MITEANADKTNAPISRSRSDTLRMATYALLLLPGDVVVYKEENTGSM